jgi:hypothetical protein
MTEPPGRRSVLKQTLLVAVLGAAGTPTADCSDRETATDPVQNTAGKWRTVSESLSMVPIHAALLNNGEVLFFAPSLRRLPEHPPESPFAWPDLNEMDIVSVALFQAAGDTIRYPPMSRPRNLFCSGHAFLPDGRLLVAGGHAHPGNIGGPIGCALARGADHDIHLFDPATNVWTRRKDMGVARWYPTCTTLEDGRVLIVSGFSKGVRPNPCTPLPPFPIPLNGDYDIFDPNTGDVSERRGRWLNGLYRDPTYPQGEQTLYPFVKVLPGGTLFSHDANITRLFVPDAQGGSLGRSRSRFEYSNIASRNLRTYPGQGACVILPLTPSTAQAKVLIVGGASEVEDYPRWNGQATNTAEIFQFDSQQSPSERQTGWRPTAPMRHRRFMSDAVILPDGTVFVTGGSESGIADDNGSPVLVPELFNPVSETWAEMAAQSIPRRYHSVALLLPSGRVLSAGSSGTWPHAPAPLDNRHPAVEPEYQIEIFSPPYLFRDTRPAILEMPDPLSYNSAIQIRVLSDKPVKAVSMVRPGSVTHTNDMDQRLIWLALESQVGDSVTVRTPPDGTWAPPGYYMIFVIDEAGTPSHGYFRRLA